MTGCVTRRGMARGTDTGGRDRTVPRCFQTAMNGVPWPWVRLRPPRLAPDAVIVTAGEHVVVTPSGQQTDGFERLCSSLEGKAVPGRCWLSVAWLSVKRRTSDPARIAPVDQAPVAHKRPQKTSGGPRGRPTGRNHRHRRAVA